MSAAAIITPVPVAFKDIGKLSNDLLSKDYPKPGSALEVLTKARNGVTFKVAGNQDVKTDHIAGELEVKHVDPKLGTTATATWFTNSLVKGQLDLENQLAKGLKFDILTSLQPETSALTAVLGATYKLPGMNAHASFDFFKGPTFTGDVVLSQQGFLTGAEATYNINDGQIKRYNLAAGYSNAEYNITLHALNSLSTYSASYYHRVNPDIEAGAKAIYNTKSTTSDVQIEVGAKTYLDNAAFVKTKINSAGILGLGYTQLLRPGVTANFGLLVDTKTLGSKSAEHSKAHSLGFSLTFKS